MPAAVVFFVVAAKLIGMRMAFRFFTTKVAPVFDALGAIMPAAVFFVVTAKLIGIRTAFRFFTTKFGACVCVAIKEV